jgi:DoxX-like family
LSASNAVLAIVAGALADIIIGLLVLYRPTSRHGLFASLGLSIIYAILGSFLRPDLWLEPLGPLVKIMPIAVLNLVALAILDDR